MIAIDGACRGNNSADQMSRRASYGVYFGIASPHNFYGCLPHGLLQSSNRAEIEAAVQAVERVAKLDLTGQRTNKVIIKTDSEYLFKSMTEWMGKRLDNGGRKSDGGPVEHWHTLKALHHRIGELSTGKRLKILFWWVPRENNTMADRLANRALDGGSDSGIGSEQSTDLAQEESGPDRRNLTSHGSPPSYTHSAF